MKAKAVDAGNGRHALMLAVTVNGDEPAGPLFADFKPYVKQWKTQSGEAAKLLLVTVIAPPERVQEIAYTFVGHVDSDGELAPLLADLDESSLIFGTSAGEEIARYELRPAGVGSGEDSADTDGRDLSSADGTAGEGAAEKAAQLPPYPMADGSVLRSMLGPLSIDGGPLCRIVAWFGDQGVEDIWVEGWTGSQWSSAIPNLPKVEACMVCAPATAEQLIAQNVPAEPWPSGYQPKTE